MFLQESVEYGSGVLGYEVEWGPVGGAKHVMPLPQSPCEASLTHLLPNTPHTARVKVRYLPAGTLMYICNFTNVCKCICRH